ncbi:hypothetical protein MKJ01_06245 [Chryseobacterium sp. SSA4.19]|uniref:hypothetical protein n=1 Tax=Chryseobacterium sp. SSA4.19 TaxID=2919915 RepID=UPI001F4E3923|nr:hypothetical protein [Chryseobacterium sp. SSA4.19]MCJ8153361.1 hypothetical protein [Chryseobacterium sp. SSA4.19]
MAQYVNPEVNRNVSNNNAMNYLVIFIFTIFFLIIYLDRSYSDKIVRKELQKLVKINNKICFKKFNVKCSNFTSGRKNLGFHYRKADLYFVEDAFIIVGFYTIFTKKIYRSILILTSELEFYRSTFNKADEVTIPNRLNTDSLNKDVYIEFGQSSFTSTNVSIHLKNLSDAEKKFITIEKNYD